LFLGCSLYIIFCKSARLHGTEPVPKREASKNEGNEERKKEKNLIMKWTSGMFACSQKRFSLNKCEIFYTLQTL
jgi:hypothetical protein